MSQFFDRHPRIRAVIGYAVLALLALVLIVGTFHVGTFLFWFIAGIIFHIHIPQATITAFQGFINTNFTTQIPVWVTGIATLGLWRATVILSRLAQAQKAIVNPLLEFGLLVEDINAPTGSGNHDSYNENWRDEDSKNAQLHPYIDNQPPCYIRIKVENVQPNVYGLATKITGKVILAFGAKNNVDNHPFTIVRNLDIPVIGAGKYVEGPIFNIGTLPNFVVLIDEIQYFDIQNIGHKAAYGVGRLWKRLDGKPIVITQKIFEPGKGELR